MLLSNYDIHEYSMMEDFIETIDDVKLYNKLCIAINGQVLLEDLKILVLILK